ncbi:MAG TPA: hypothetical protein VFN67_34325 [Polyangiales bacterium]|nr:hypothetical protein [Polyangiales bacterium]
MTRLRSCDSCARHVFVTEQACPFCRAPLTAAAEPVRVAIPSGASRAQRLALAAAIGGSSLIGCADTGSATSPDEVAGSPAPTAGAGGHAGSGTKPPTAGRAAPPGGGVVVPVYGAPAPGNPPQAGRAAQPTAGRGSVEVPIYGAPVAGSPAEEDDAGVPEAGSAAAGSGGRAAPPKAGSSAAGSGGHVAVPVYGAPLPEYGAPPPPKN